MARRPLSLICVCGLVLSYNYLAASAISLSLFQCELDCLDEDCFVAPSMHIQIGTGFNQSSDTSFLDHKHKNTINIYTIMYSTLHYIYPESITPPILPPSPPSLLPKPTIKLLLPQLPIHLIMRLAHPRPEILPPTQPRLIPTRRLSHPRPEVIRAHPARVQAREEREEAAHLGLLLSAGFRWVSGC